MMRTSPLHPKFGVEVHGVDLRRAAADDLFPKIRAVFDRHSALLFRDQSLDDAAHQRLARLFGPIENRDAMATGRDEAFATPLVSNETDDGVLAPDALALLDLQANMLWHTDSTFLPIPALSNIITARVVPTSGGETELASTRVGWEEAPASLRAALKDAILWHRLSHSRARISAELAAAPRMTRWPDRPWRAIWPNPATGVESLYIASHAFAVEGLGHAEGAALIARAVDWCTRPGYVYTHRWSVGDVLIWDERATLHRGRPWPYEEPRTLASICSSTTEADGLASVRIV